MCPDPASFASAPPGAIPRALLSEAFRAGSWIATDGLPSTTGSFLDAAGDR